MNFTKKKLFLLFLLVAVGLSAQTKEKTITVSFSNIPLSTAVARIEKASSYTFFYDASKVDLTQTVSLSAKNMPVFQAVANLLRGTNISFEITNTQIALFKKETVQESGKPPSRQKITGSVTDNDTGEPVAGATVRIADSHIGVLTDLSGKFTIDAPEGGMLQISSIGYLTQAVSLTGKYNYVITLAEDTRALDEVVVIGYGTQRRSLVANAISKVKIEDKDLRQALSPSQLLEGKVAGLTVITGSGNLGAGERMSIRGASSLSASNEPLYIIDGIPNAAGSANIFNLGESMSSLASLNLNDIESIEVLKDAASAAIYGSRATNGVIVITTKSGKKGVSNVRLNISTGISQFANPKKLKFANSDLFLLQYNEGVDNYNRQNGLCVGSSGYLVHWSNPFQGLPDSDWLSYITQTGSAVNADLSFSGGVNKTTYYISGAASTQKGIIRTNALNKINLKVKIDHEVRPWLEVGANVSGNYVKNYQVPGANAGSTILARAVEQRPFDRPYKPNGEYYVGGTDLLTRHNPVQILNEQRAYFDNFRYIGNFYSLLKFKEKFTWKSSLNNDISYTYDYTHYNEKHPYSAGNGRIIEYNRLLNNFLIENIFNYNDQFKNLGLNAMLGHSFQKASTHTSMIDGRGFPSAAFDVISAAAEIYDASGNIAEYAMESYFGRATLSYLEKYILTATLRTDGSSKFAPETRYGWFPSISLGWNIAKEEFMKNSGAELKFRVSYGKTGNQDGINYYRYLPQMSGGKNYGGKSGIAVTEFGNTKLTWETADQFDVGFDIELWKGRVNMIIDGYLKNTNNLLYNMPMHATTGVTSIMNNIGSMRNVGLEYTLNTHFKFGKVEWLSQFNIATNKNKITKLISEDGLPMSIGGNRALQVGKELGAFYLFKMEGIYQYDGEVPQPFYDLGIRAGDVKWYDADKNQIINDNDRVVMRAPNPKFFGGWNNTFKYKGFQMDIFASYMYGNLVYNERYGASIARIGAFDAVLEKYVLNRWTGPGSTNLYPRSITSTTNNNRNSDRWLEDGSFIRLRSLTFSYNISGNILKKTHLKGLRIFAQGDNLFLLTNYSGYDPEVSTELNPSFGSVDNLNVPQPRTISIGANFNF